MIYYNKIFYILWELHMKHLRYTFCLLTFIATHSFTMEEGQRGNSNKIPQAINITVSPNFTNNPQIKTKLSNENSSSQSASLSSNVKSIWKSIINFKIPDAWKQNASSFLLTYKYHLIGGAFLCTYAGILYKTHNCKNYLHDENSWANWRSDIPVEELLTTDPDNLREELLLAMHTKYIHPEEPLGTVHSLVQFMKDVETEIQTLKKYRTYITWIKRLKINYVLPFGIPDIQECTTKIERLSFLQVLFRSWAAQQNLRKYGMEAPLNSQLNYSVRYNKDNELISPQP